MPPRKPVPEEIVLASQRTLDAAFEVHTEIGPGCLESVYELALSHVLADYGLRVERQKAIPFNFRGETMKLGFRADLLVEDSVIVEVKVAKELAPIHHAQTRTYLNLSGKPVALLLNFGAAHLRDGYDRLVHHDYVFLPPSRAFPKSSGPRVPSGPRE
jgi:iron complex transport system substrate-binding protein